jgi:hypothetical protein
MRRFTIYSLYETLLGQWAVHVAVMGELRNAYMSLAGKCERQTPLGRFWCRQMIILQYLAVMRELRNAYIILAGKRERENTWEILV